ncbi:MAG TPA: alpha/beta fold hydrolase [Xanthomonadales bacterium]|nr:alpha/beta fold hydrolase [Xanthomonadales bacterium]
MMNDERVWRHQLAALRPRCSDIQVADITTADTIEEIARLVLQSAPEKFSLAGFSMGGIVALEIIRQAPQRIVRLALLGSTARNEKPHQIEPRLALMERARREPMDELMQKVLIPPSLGKANQNDLLIKWEIQDMGQLLGTDIYLRQCQALNTRRDYRESLAAIHCPTLVLCGEEDQVCPPWMSEQIADGIKGSTLQIIKGSGHMITLEAPEEVSAAMLGWLAKPGST